MSSQVYPTPAGLGWSVVKSPLWSTIQQRATSGRESRVQLFTYPLWRFTLTYEFLRSGTRRGTAYTELQQFADFYNARGGAFDDFLFDDVSDDAAVDMPFGSGDGAETEFQLTRVWSAGGFAEPVMNVHALTNVKDNGVVVSGSDYTLGSTGVVTFNTPPVSGHALTWNGTYYFRCRFADDNLDLDQFMSQLWSIKQVKLIGSLGLKV